MAGGSSASNWVHQSHQHGKQKVQSVTKKTEGRNTAENNTTYPYRGSIQDTGLTAKHRSTQEKAKFPNLSLNGAPGTIAGVDAPAEAGQGH